MPSTTQTKPTKKKRAPVEDEAVKSDGTRPARRTKKPAAESTEEPPESDVSDSTPDETEPKPRKAKSPKSKASARSKKSKAAGASKDSSPPDDAPAAESKSSAKPPASKPRGRAREPVDLGRAVLQALATNERMNQFLLEHLDDRAWSAPPRSGQGRTIAAIVSHMHNVRHMWLTVAAKKKSAPEKLDRKTVTKPQAMKALAASSQALLALFERSLEQGGRVKEFKPDAVGFLGYVIAHEAHHRGQICMLARELEMKLSDEAGYGMWDWKKRWEECGVE